MDATGIRVDSSLTLPPDRYVGRHPLRIGNRLYDMFGRILDATTGDLLGTIPMPGLKHARCGVAGRAQSTTVRVDASPGHARDGEL